jgi:hypothetical protein
LAFVTTFRINGDPDELLKFKQEVMDPVVEPAARENGIVEHITCRTDDGLVVVNIWETLEGSEKTAEAARAAAEGHGNTDARPSDWQSYEIVERVVV